MITFIFWVRGIINSALWALNLAVHLKARNSERLVLMATLPIGIVVSLVSLVIVGFLT